VLPPDTSLTDSKNISTINHEWLTRYLKEEEEEEEERENPQTLEGSGGGMEL